MSQLKTTEAEHKKKKKACEGTTVDYVQEIKDEEINRANKRDINSVAAKNALLF